MTDGRFGCRSLRLGFIWRMCAPKGGESGGAVRCNETLAAGRRFGGWSLRLIDLADVVQATKSVAAARQSNETLLLIPAPDLEQLTGAYRHL
jgi:hypothetical protein